MGHEIEHDHYQPMPKIGRGGSRAAPGWVQPEGVVLFHTQTGAMFKWTFDGDGHKESQ